MLGTDVAVASVPNGCDGPACEGDCSGDGNVTIHELITAVGLDNYGSRCGCAAFAPYSSPHVPMDALIRAVRLALDGCP